MAHTDASTVHQVLKNETKENILELLQNKIDPNCIGENGDTTLHAILKNDKFMEYDVVEILTYFLTQGVNPNIKNKQEATALHLAIGRRMKNAVDLLLKFKADLHAVSRRGNTIAHFFIKDEQAKCKAAAHYPIINSPENRHVAELSSLDFLDFLIFKGLKFGYINNEGENAMHLAIKNSMPYLLPTLFQQAKNNDKPMLFELLFEVSSKPDEYSHPEFDSHYMSESVAILLETGLPTIGDNKKGCTLISDSIKNNTRMSIVKGMISYYLSKCHEEHLATNLYHALMSTCQYWRNSDADYFLTVLYELAFKGVNVNVESEKYVLSAMKAKDLYLLEFLKAQGAEFTFRLKNGKTALHILAEDIDYEGSVGEFYEKFCYMLVGNDFSLNSTDSRGKSALHIAAGHGNILMARTLIDLGADINCKDLNLCTPLHEALRMNPPIVSIELLLTCGADVDAKDCTDQTPLHLAVFKNDLAAVRLLIQNGADAGCMDIYQRSPLHGIKWETKDALEIIDLLVSSGANVNVQNSKGETPLHLVISYNNVSLIQSLIDLHADVNCKDEFQQTPLHCAVINNSPLEVIELLLSNGADVNAEDYEGTRPLNFVFKRSGSDSIEILQILLFKGAYVNVRNNRGESALFHAFSSGKYLLVEELLKYNANIDDPHVQQLLPQVISNYPMIYLFLSKYWIKLMIAELPLDEEYKSVKLATGRLHFDREYRVYLNNDDDTGYRNRCSNEIKELKTMLIDGNQSLYDFLHMKPEQRCAFIKEEKFKQLMESSKLELQFPEYSVILLSSYRESKAWNKEE